MTRTKLSLLIPLLGGFSAYSWADDTEQQSDALNIQATVVSATRSEASIASIPGSVQVIDEQQIREQSGAGRRVSDILGQLVPGLAPSTGGMSNYGQTLRGRSVLVLIDGVSQNATRDNFRQLNSISPASIERIEVVSGASSVYGAGASGGIINIITKRNQGQEAAYSSKLGMTTGNNFNRKGFAYEAFQSATGRKDALDWYVSADLTQRNDQFDGNGHRIPQDTSQGSSMDTETYDLQGRFGYELDENKKVSLSLQDYKDEQDTGYTKDPKNKQEAVAIKGLRLDDQPYTHNQAVNLNYTDKDFHGQGLQLESYWRRADALFFPDVSRGFAGISDNNSVQNVYGLRAAIDTPLPAIGSATGNLVWGADYDNERSTQRGDQYSVKGLDYTKTGTTFELGPDTETTTKAIYGQMSWDIADWTVRGGIRREWIESDVSDSIAYGEIVQTGNYATLPGETLKYDATLYNLGAVYHLSENQDVFVNYSQGFSLPDIQRFLRDVNSSFNIQTLDAQAIKVDSYELGWRGDWDQWQADVTVYENTSDVTQFYDANERVLRLIDQKERVRGIENSLTYRATDRWSVGGTYAWAKGETQQNGKWIDLPATRISPAKTTLFVGYTEDDYTLRLQGMQLASYDAALKDDNGRDINGYTLVDLLGSVELPVGRLEGGVFNLTDRNYQNLFAQSNAKAPYANAEGRTFSMSYSLDW
ncbi:MULTISPECIES: TonB-dependent receptor [Pseudomonas]|jgi:iron complex outermembrane receptor protein|uniref:TonB-dependent receptor n=1 Tax=Pseudomonas kielensis TaxID=2762577 RepID=A0A7X1GFR0_9PSED|nr:MULTISPECIES: TonB-dependent receptor [Pseudomonas]MBC2691652.1 TonB-dependent receptor [Pseudomonas kielensis]NBB36207.1 TonB-dependent receptor [Pseudomonas sp. BC115LW]WKL53655.1 TonB-dependent receptor [Pseudomonas kielensis]